MNVRLLACLLACMAIFSCSKNDADTPTEEVTHRFKRMAEGDPAKPDHIYFFSYDSVGRMTSVVDSASGITVKGEYGSNGKIGTFIYSSPSGYSRTAAFKYNADNQVIEIDRGPWFQDRYTFEYQNGVLSRCNWYKPLNSTSTTYSLSMYYTYEMENGNIAKRINHDANGNVLGGYTFTYTDKPNRFDQMSMFSEVGGPGLIYFLHSFELMFNKNLIAGFRGGGNHISTFTYIYNTNSQLISSTETWTSTTSDYLYENPPKVLSY